MTTEKEEYQVSYEQILKELLNHYELGTKNISFLTQDMQAKYLKIYSEFLKFISYLEKEDAKHFFCNIELKRPQWSKEFDKRIKEIAEEIKKTLIGK